MTDQTTAVTRLAAIRVGGDDATEFLQGQLSCDVTSIATGSVVDGAWLNPAGRVIMLAQLVKTEADYVIYLAADLLDAVLARLTMFRLRSAVEFTVEREWTATTSAPADPLATRALAGTTLTEYFSKSAAEVAPDWALARLHAGIVWIDAANKERYTAHQINLDRLGAVSLSKGCYSGQEIVARTEHRGRVKRRAQRLVAHAGTAALVSGADVTDAGNKVGSVIASASAPGAETEVLALLPIDCAASLTCDDWRLELADLPYSTRD